MSIKLVITRPQADASQEIRQLTQLQVNRLRAFVHKRVMNPDDADDILQCTFLEALRNEHKFRHASKPDTWLCGIALNLIRNHFRRHYHQPYQECLDDHPNITQEHADIGQVVDDRRQLQRTVEALKTLPDNMQQVIHVSLVMDGNYQDTAHSLGVPIGTVRSRLSRAREQLRRAVGPSA